MAQEQNGVGRLTTHVLDTATGRPAAGMPIELFRLQDGRREKVASARTNADGRCDAPLLSGEAFSAGTYELVFAAGAYLDGQGAQLPEPKFLDEVVIRFGVAEAKHYHVPLLLSPFGYSTYRGELRLAPIRFILNGEEREVDGLHPTTTVLNYLRGVERLTGTKEGCAEGDCGACTVMLTEADSKGGVKRRSMNSCILFLPALHGRAVDTVEALGGDHPLQTAMVERHASQCGFCTPGFVMQLYAGWLNGGIGDRPAVKDLIAGNLCRCTGYGPIVEAGLDLAGHPRPDTREADPTLAERLTALRGESVHRYQGDGGTWLSPTSVDELADLYTEHPDARLVAGATDVGLWVTKQHRDLPLLIDVSRVADLSHVEEGPGRLYLGAAVTLRAAAARLGTIHADIGETLRRFAGAQIRNAGTVGGNIANGSPIGDLPPVLIALGATLHLRQADEMRALPLEYFFLEYGKQDRRPGEFVAAVEVPLLQPNERFAAYKISKRADSDISAVMAAFKLTFEGERVRDARLAFGGMAGTPKRARHAEEVLLGRRFDEAAARDAMAALGRDFQPLTDMRATADYRLKAAQNCLERFRLEQAGIPTRIAAVA